MAAHAAALDESFGSRRIGLYVHGSIALHDFDPRTSDVDFLAVLAGGIGAEDLRTIRGLHRRLLRTDPEARRLEGMYVPEADAALPNFVRPHPYVKQGRLRTRGHRVGPTARALVRERGLAVAGPAPVDVFREVPPDAIREEMDFNLNVYWAGRARRPYLFLFDRMADFAVLTVPRILHTLETGSMISKRRAADYLDARFPEWAHLVRDVRRRFHPGRSPSPILARPRRALLVRRFVREMITYADSRYGLRGRSPAP